MIGSILDIGSTIIDKIWPDAGDREKARLRLVEMQSRGELAELENRVKVIASEMSGNWLQRSWRPVLMLTIIAIVANNYLFYPYVSLFWEEAPKLELPGRLWSLMEIGLGGYVFGRSAEKITDKWRKNGN